MMNRLLLIAIILQSLFCCQSTETSKEQNTIVAKPANYHMNKTSFEELVQRFEDSSRTKWQKPELVINKLGELQGKTVADLGAGTGYFTFRLAEKGAKVIALDVDNRFLNYIDNKNEDLGFSTVETRRIPYDQPRLDSNSIDALITVNTYHHIEERSQYFRKVLFALKKGGKLMVVDFKKEKTPHGPPIEMRLTGFEVLKELQKAGFTKVIIDVATLSEQYIITAKKADKAIDQHPLLRDVRKK